MSLGKLRKLLEHRSRSTPANRSDECLLAGVDQQILKLVFLRVCEADIAKPLGHANKIWIFPYFLLLCMANSQILANGSARAVRPRRRRAERDRSRSIWTVPVS